MTHFSQVPPKDSPEREQIDGLEGFDERKTTLDAQQESERQSIPFLGIRQALRRVGIFIGRTLNRFRIELRGSPLVGNENSVFEMYYETESSKNLNYIYIGRIGLDGSLTKTHYLELRSTIHPTLPQSNANGRVILGTVTQAERAGTTVRHHEIEVSDARLYGGNLNDTFVLIMAKGNGMAAIGHAGNGLVYPIFFVSGKKAYIDYDSLPTADPNARGQLWVSGTDLRISAG